MTLKYYLKLVTYTQHPLTENLSYEIILAQNEQLKKKQHFFFSIPLSPSHLSSFASKSPSSLSFISLLSPSQSHSLYNTITINHHQCVGLSFLAKNSASEPKSPTSLMNLSEIILLSALVVTRPRCNMDSFIMQSIMATRGGVKLLLHLEMSERFHSNPSFRMIKQIKRAVQSCTTRNAETQR